MTDAPFFKTRMGQRFLERTIPDLVKQLERIADRLPEPTQEWPAGVDDLLRATYGLVSAVDELLETEIVPGSEATQRAFRNLRARTTVARQAADGVR